MIRIIYSFTIILSTSITIFQPNIVLASIPKLVSDVAKRITVRIDGVNLKSKPINGSGSIIERKGNIYTVITNYHVVKDEGNYIITTTIDNKTHTVDYNTIKQIGKEDLAELQFTGTSNDNYFPVKLGNSSNISGNTVYVFGWSFIKQSNVRQYIALDTTVGVIEHPVDNYALSFQTTKVKPGMSGGPVLDEWGHLIGVVGEIQAHILPNGVILVDDLGIPIDIYKNTIPHQQSPTKDVELKSSIGIDYSKLRDFLANKEWYKADDETYLIIKSIIAKEEHSDSDDEIKSYLNFPCEDIKIIDNLWSYYSNGKFGFSIQNQIYENSWVENYSKDDELAWNEFIYSTGWRRSRVDVDDDSLEILRFYEEKRDLKIGEMPVAYLFKLGFNTRYVPNPTVWILSRQESCQK